VTLVDLSADSLSQAAASLAGGSADIKSRLHTYAGDVSVEGTAEGYVKETVEKWGRVDVSVQCAGISLPSADLVDLKVSDWDKTMGVNLRGGAFSEPWTVVLAATAEP
jgi:NAD(P)-dependent dehydrogenase (short-subunit alcohol dehydrogenase family)